MTLDITLACHEYEWTRALWDGRVEPQGVDLTTVDYRNPERFTRMVRHLEFDACEMSMGTYLASRDADGEFPFTAIPVFPYRKFRHSYMYKRPGAGIEEPADLAGAPVGIVNWQTTTGIWQRGILADRYGLDLSTVEWYASGSEIIDLDLDYDITYLDAGDGGAMQPLEAMVEREELDAILHPAHSGSEATERLFEHPIETEKQYYRETSIFPIMHAIVLRDSIIEEHPWVLQPLFDAFEEAKRLGLERLERPRWMPLLWSQVLADRQRDLLGDDPWEYGLTEDNVTTLETLVGYAADQGLIADPYDLDDLFETETLNPGWFGSQT